MKETGFFLFFIGIIISISSTILLIYGEHTQGLIGLIISCIFIFIGVIKVLEDAKCTKKEQ